MARYDPRDLEKERRITELAKIAATRFGEGDTLRRATQPLPKAEVPFMTKEMETGRLGDIMRKSPKELEAFAAGLPEKERPIEAIRGTDRTYWSPGTRQEYGDLRTALTGFKQRPEGTAEERLAGVMAERDRKVGLEKFGAKATELFGPHMITDAEGKPALSPDHQAIFNTANVMATEGNYEGAVKHIETGLAKDVKATATQKRMDALRNMSIPELEKIAAAKRDAVATEAETLSTAAKAVAEASKPKPQKPHQTLQEGWRKTQEEGFKEMGDYLGNASGFVDTANELLDTPTKFYWDLLGKLGKSAFESQAGSIDRLSKAR